MATEKFERESKVDDLEIQRPIDVEMAAGEIRDFLFNPADGNPFGADRFTLEQLKEKYFAQSKKDIITPITPSVFPEALQYLCDNGLLGFDKKTDTYYDKESA
jgi:hypothetical protein